jgi:hypothetical protein
MNAALAKLSARGIDRAFLGYGWAKRFTKGPISTSNLLKLTEVRAPFVGYSAIAIAQFRRTVCDQKRIVPDAIVELPSQWFVALNSV